MGAHIAQQSPRSRKRRAARVEPSMGAHYRNPELEHVKALTLLLEGKEFCVMTGLPSVTKQDLECKIKENGGSVVLNPGTSNTPIQTFPICFQTHGFSLSVFICLYLLCCICNTLSHGLQIIWLFALTALVNSQHTLSVRKFT